MGCAPSSPHASALALKPQTTDQINQESPPSPESPVRQDAESKRQQELEAYALEEEIRLGTALGVELEQIITSGQLLRADHKERALDAYDDRHPRLAESLRSKMGKAFQGVLAVQKKGKGHAEGDGNITTASMGQ